MKEQTQRWLMQFCPKLKAAFSSRIRFVGLQGSRRREEETDNSDLDLVVILDRVDFEDLAIYRSLLKEMPGDLQPCGFLCGVDELKHWPVFDLFNFYHDTQPLEGRLSDLIPVPGSAEAAASVQAGAAGLYHEIVHREIYGQSTSGELQASFKLAKYLVAAREFLRTGTYEGRLKPLLDQSKGIDREILQCCLDGVSDLEEGSRLLLRFCQYCLKDNTGAENYPLS